jgi:(p)ppGpp synthase/HD superfamily hydrolase
MSDFSDNALKEMLLKAEQIARQAHSGQFRRDGVTPYITHPEKVVAALSTDEDKTVGWLHDVLEDTSIQPIELILHGIDKVFVLSVKAITKKPFEDYEVYLQRVKSDPRAKAVKLKDIDANLADSPTEKQVLKYSKAIAFLNAP